MACDSSSLKVVSLISCRVSRYMEWEEAEANFREIVATYEVLSDKNKRTRYDRGEDLEDMGMGGGGGGGGFNPFGGWGQHFT
ncbi:dnaJ protein P58IPK-like protein [Senna tora]|uniref:DnaJ protein P58IPK-like protein n=1 Tax=Senna tora TaxID=362788 RepID=A0A835C950_9FABA|nr:dnaJ protein P58IPK-like protein [Senna tora]